MPPNRMIRFCRVTVHAATRLNQRGIVMEDLELLLDWADEHTAVRGRASSLWRSRDCLAEMRAEGVPAARLGRLNRLATVVNGGHVITALRMHGRSARRYRKGH